MSNLRKENWKPWNKVVHHVLEETTSIQKFPVSTSKSLKRSSGTHEQLLLSHHSIFRERSEHPNTAAADAYISRNGSKKLPITDVLKDSIQANVKLLHFLFWKLEKKLSRGRCTSITQSKVERRALIAWRKRCVSQSELCPFLCMTHERSSQGRWLVTSKWKQK